MSGVTAWPIAVRAQQAGKVYLIGYLSYSSPASTTHFVEAFRQGMRELGWIEGQNIIIDYRFAEGQSDRLPNLAADLIRVKADVIVASTTQAAVAAKNATGAIPIVTTNFGDPVGVGLIAGLPRPGGNITGLSSSVGVDTFGKLLELLKDTVPTVRRVAILSNPDNPSHALAITNVKLAAQALGVELKPLGARGPNELYDAVAAISNERDGALIVLADAVFNVHRVLLADLASKNRLPTMYGIRENVEAGGLISYGPNIRDLFRRAAGYVDKILKGAQPAELPVEQPTKFELVINLKTAKALGLTVPPTLLARADEVIE
jgi:putative ABC transport system substrate-binding protein